MIDWWTGLSALNQGLFVAAVFFSTLLIWQLVSSLSGVVGGESGGLGDGDADGDLGMDEADLDVDTDLGDGDSGLVLMRLLSVRSLIAFGALFSWAGALYLAEDRTVVSAMALAAVWGFTGMLVVALFFWMLPRLSEEGTASLDTAIGQVGQVYLDIPPEGAGQIRVLVSGAVSFVKARSRHPERLPAGTPVRVVGRLDSRTLEVEALPSNTEQ